VDTVRVKKTAKPRTLRGVPLQRECDIMNRSRFSFLPAVVLTTVVLASWTGHGAAQEVALTPLESKEVAKGYRADALKLKTVVNDKGETIGRISDFIFGQDNNIYVVLSVGSFTGLTGQLVAIPFRVLKFDDRSDNIVLPGASRAALEKLPVFVSNR
jgi:sporulation protein YlmC with PRC-barrel domain